jgi:hypothetical protein
MITEPGAPDPEPAQDPVFENTCDTCCPAPPARLFRKIAGLLRKCGENPFILIVVSGIIVILFGIAGFSEYYSDHPEDGAGLSDIIYQTFQLFALNSSKLVTKPPLLLEIARFSAAIFVALALVSILLKIFWEQVQSLRLLFSLKPKAVICGLGYLGPLYAREFVRRGYLTVVIEKDPQAPRAGLPETGLFFISGDATDPAVLRRIHIRHSDIMVTATGDDLTNIRIAMTAREVVNNYQPSAESSHHDGSLTEKNPLFLIHILDRWLDNALSTRFFPMHKDRTPQFFHFNMYTRAAKKLVPYIWDDLITPEPDRTVTAGFHILLIGVGTMGEEVCKQFIERWNRENKYRTDPKPCLTISLLDYKDAGDKAKRLQLWIQEMKCPQNTVIIRYYAIKVPSAEFLDGNYLRTDPEGRPVPPLSAVIICLANPTLAMTTALEIVPVIRKSRQTCPGTELQFPPVYIRFIRNDEITRFIYLLKKQEPFSIFTPYTVAEYGAFWNDDLELRFPYKQCRYLQVCPFSCQKKKGKK